MPDDDQILIFTAVSCGRRGTLKQTLCLGFLCLLKKITCLGLFTPMLSVLNYLVSLSYMRDNSVLLTVGLALVLRAIL